MGSFFGFVVSGNDNTEDVEFYVDEISYYFPDKVGAPAIAEHRMTIQEIIALIGAVTGALAIIIDIIKIKKIKDK